MIIRRLCWTVMAGILVACGGGSGSLPPLRPAGAVSGNAVAGEIDNAQVAVYALGPGGKGALLDSATTDAQGHYALDLRAPSQPVLIEVSGGNYVEEASGVTVEMGEGQVLRAVARYQSGQPLAVMVTPLTQLAAGLAQYRIAQGTDPATAVNSALDDIDRVFGVAVSDVVPHNITDPGGATTQLSAEYRYGFLLAALSSFTDWVSNENGVAPHTAYTSLALSQVMYNDIHSDGLLDGRGLNKSGDGLMDLALGTVALNQDVYRTSIAEHLLAMGASARNKTGLTPDDLHAMASGLNADADALFGGKAPAPVTALAPVIEPVLAPGSSFNGVYDFEVNISGVLPAASVNFTVDGVTLGDALDPVHPSVSIDTRGYGDGEHIIGVTVTDALGLSSHQDFTYRFHNVFVNVTSAAFSNHTPFTLSGNYGDNDLGLKSLTVQGRNVVPDADKTWSVAVDLSVGRNHIPIVLQTVNGGSDTSEAVVDYDVGLPLIDSSAGHGAGCFSNGDGTCTAQPLADTNSGPPLSIETDHTELAGVAVTRTDLGANNIPYFAFTASDPLSNGVGTPADQLTVRMQYEKNSKVELPWTVLKAVKGEYLIPLATEMLGDAWLRSTPNDIQTLRVQAEDLAGNTTETLFTFKVDFVVAPFTVGPSADAATALFSGTAFADRASLYSTTISAVSYPFTNTTGKGFYISLSDDSVHGVDNLIDQLVRVNQVRLKTTTEWRAGFVSNVSDTSSCPSASPMTSITQVLNYTAEGAWVTAKVPDPTLGSVSSASSDSPASPAPTSWTQFDMDGAYATLSAPVPGPGSLTLSFDYDYLNASSQPAAVHNWKVLESDSSTKTACADVNALEQRETYSYESEPGYPQNQSSTLHDGASFGSSGFTVFDETTNATITGLSGWFLIPAGHAVVVNKQVSLPALTVHNDTDVADPTTFTSYAPHLYDHTLTWTIQRALKMVVAHDAGPDNLFSMSSREVDTGSGAASYVLTR